MRNTTMNRGALTTGLALSLVVLLLAACDRQAEEAMHEPLQEAAERAAERAEEMVEGLTAEEGDEDEEHTEDGEEEPTPSEAAPGEGDAAAPAGDAAAGMAMGADHETIEVDESEIVAQPGASMGDAARCPVSGETFRVRDTSPTAEHEGETYFFCCGSCVRPFLRNPDQYLSAAAD